MKSKINPETFVENLAQAFVPKSIVGFKIDTTKTKNSYYLAFKTGSNEFSPNIRLLEFYHGDLLRISNLDSLMKKTNPEIMFRSTNFMSLDHMCTTYGLNKTEVCKCILNSLRQRIVDFTRWNNSIKISSEPYNSYSHSSDNSSNTATVDSIDELAVWVDLHAFT